MMYRAVRNPANPRSSQSFPCCACLCILLLTAAMLCALPYVMSRMKSLDEIPEDSDEISSAFTRFMADYEKSYSDEELPKRKAIFAENYRLIKENNDDPTSTVELEVNKFADLSEEEFKSLHLQENPACVVAEPTFTEYIFGESSTKAPGDVSIDWVEKKKVNLIKDQGPCGSCWVFAAMSVVETIEAIKNNVDFTNWYAEQEIVDCCRTSKSKGCAGGLSAEAWDCIIKGGINYEANYPYLAYDDVCRDVKAKKAFPISDHKDIETLKNSQMEEWILNRTIAVGVNAGPYVFRFYRSGVVTRNCNSDSINHGVVIVGAGEEKGIKYWKVRNSWGPNWGDQGYLKIQRKGDGEKGLCSINSCPQVVMPK